MAKAITPAKKQNKIDVNNLSPRDLDHLTLDTKDLMKKYKVEKQAVYDRRFALNKKIKAAGLSVDQLKSGEPVAEAEKPVAKTEKPAAKKRGRPKSIKPAGEATTPKKSAPVKADEPVEAVETGSREVMVIKNQVPVIMKPIEINFDNFSVKLNGVPKKISINPDTNAIEIDL